VEFVVLLLMIIVRQRQPHPGTGHCGTHSRQTRLCASLPNHGRRHRGTCRYKSRFIEGSPWVTSLWARQLGILLFAVMLCLIVLTCRTRGAPGIASTTVDKCVGRRCPSCARDS
jgi:hypothetical protein